MPGVGGLAHLHSGAHGQRQTVLSTDNISVFCFQRDLLTSNLNFYVWNFNETENHEFLGKYAKTILKCSWKVNSVITGMCTLDLLAVNYNSQLTQTQTLWLPLHLNKVTL